MRLNPFSNFVNGDIFESFCFALLDPVFCIASVYTNV